jgi:glycosyltransferase involved in cell wall biosynthesis
VRILIDLQPLQTVGAATRGVGRYTNGLLSALAPIHDVIGMQRACSYLIPPSADVPTVEIASGTDLEQQLLDWHSEVVINCSGPFWAENVIVSSLRRPHRPVVASIFYDVIPWVFPDVYLQDPQVRRGYHNRCVDLYARADLVCAISQHSERDALRFGYATHETATTISLGVEQLVPEVLQARQKWNISQPYLLSISGDEFRKNPELLIASYLQSDIRKSHSLVIVISNDEDTGFSRRMKAKYGNLSAQNVMILPEMTESELGALYRDCDAFVFTSLYEGFGIPIVEAMQFGKWIISSKTSSLGEVSGPALLSLIEEPGELNSIVFALNEAKRRLDRGVPEGSIPCTQSQKFSWEQVVRNFEDAVDRCREAKDLKSSSQIPERPRLLWASPFPTDESGIAFYSEDLLKFVSAYYDIILVPNSLSTFVPTAKTGRFKVTNAHAEALRSLAIGEEPLVFYNIGNSHFHLNLLELLFTLPGIVLLHDSFVGDLEKLWRQSTSALLTKVSDGKTGTSTPGKARTRSDNRPLSVQIIESSRHMLFLGDHARSLIAPEHLVKRPTNVVPLYCRYRGAISPEKKAELRLKYGIQKDAFVVTTTGFQTRMKLTDQIVRSCLELQHWEHEAKVYIQVLGHFFDTALEAEIRALLSENEVPAFMSAGFVDETLLEERVALSDVTVFLRKFSTGGPSAGLNDALGMGIPSLVTDDFAFREYPKTAVLRVANSEITEGMILLYRHRAVRQALAAGGLQHAREMSFERVASRLCEIFSLHELSRLKRCPSEKSGPRVRNSTRRVFIDITFSLMNKLRSGLQRVEREIANGLRELDPGSQCFSFVAWNSDSRCFHLVPLDHLLRREDLPPLENWLAAYPAVELDEHAELFVLGSNWALGESYYNDVVAMALKGLRLSVLIPDLIPIRHRWDFYSHYPEGATFDLFRVFCLRVLPVCSNVLTISNYVMADIDKLLLEMGLGAFEKKHIPKLHVLKLGADWSAPIVDPPNVALHKTRQFKNGYILCVSTLEKRKNHNRLLEAMRVVRDHIKDLDLVLVGGIDASIEKTTLECIRRKEWVHHFDRVDDYALRRLYEESLFTVYPSLDEGYGLPVIESLRHGKFCLASHAGAIPEAGGEWADYFDPEDIQTLAAKILKYVTNPEELQRRETLLSSYRPASWRETSWQVARVFYGDTAKDIFMAGAHQRAPELAAARGKEVPHIRAQAGEQYLPLETARVEPAQNLTLTFQADHQTNVCADALRVEPRAVYASRSWRIIEPLCNASGFIRRRLRRVSLPKANTLLRWLAGSNTVRRLGTRILAPFPSLHERARRQLRRTASGQASVPKHAVSDVANASSLHTPLSFEVNEIMDDIRYRIVEELDRFVSAQERKCLDPVESGLFAAGLCDDSRSYAVDAFRGIPEKYFFEALSILLFKRPLEKHRLLNTVKRISRRRLIVLWMCSLLPGRRARIVGLYRQLFRSALSRSPFFFSLAKRVYYRIT